MNDGTEVLARFLLIEQGRSEDLQDEGARSVSPLWKYFLRFFYVNNSHLGLIEDKKELRRIPAEQDRGQKASRKGSDG